MSHAAWRARAAAGEGFIYAARIDRTDGRSEIKVGFSLMPLRRVYRDFASFANVSKTQMLGYMPGSMRQELALHNRLFGRPRCVKNGDRESYPLSIIDHPALPRDLVWVRP